MPTAQCNEVHTVQKEYTAEATYNGVIDTVDGKYIHQFTLSNGQIITVTNSEKEIKERRGNKFVIKFTL